jgi:hypothetical protein
MKHLFGLTLAALMLGAPAGAVDLVRGRTDLPELVLGNDAGNDYAVSQKEIAMESGKSYRLSITAKGSKEYKFFATEFLRHIWINQIVINHLEMPGAPRHLEFDDQGTIHIEFVTIRPGEYSWSIEG